MARRYTRDNRGRFASVGATARGGRLRTAAGNKRATQTKQISGAKPSGTVAKPKGLKPDRNAAVKGETNQRLRARASARAATAKSQASTQSAVKNKRERVRGNFRPQNTMAKPTAGYDPYGKKKGENTEIAQAGVQAAGHGVRVTNRRRDAQGAPASANAAFNVVSINKASPYWANPKSFAREERRIGNWSTADSRGVVLHEIGHLKDKSSGWINTSSGGIARRTFASQRNQRVASRVSRYATQSPREFTAETYAGLRTGHKYDHQVMSAYRQERGIKPRSVRSQLKRK